MSNRVEGLLFVGALIVMSFLFQTQLKIVANLVAPILARTDVGAAGQLRALLGAILSWRLGLIASLAIALFIVWFLALTRLELSVALPVASVALIINTIGAGLLLGESLPAARIAGVLIVGAGLALVLRS